MTQDRETHEDLEEIKSDLTGLAQTFANHVREDASTAAKFDIMFEQIRNELANVRQELSNVSKELAGFKTDMSPVKEAYSGVLVTKNILVGVASVVLAIGAIGAGVIWIINSVVNSGR